MKQIHFITLAKSSHKKTNKAINNSFYKNEKQAFANYWRIKK